MERKDYYFILGVPRTATARDILQAYRALAKLYHPDRVGPQGTATFQDIVEAYEVLSDPERRRHYTESLSLFVDTTAAAPPVGSARPEPLIPEQRRFRLYSQPEPLVPEPMSLFADFGTIRPSLDALYDHLLQNFTGRETTKAVQLTSLGFVQDTCNGVSQQESSKKVYVVGRYFILGISFRNNRWVRLFGAPFSGHPHRISRLWLRSIARPTHVSDHH
jgi:curved DNA-binding protein CbpA